MRRLHPATIVVAFLPKLKEAVQSAIPLLIGSAATGHYGNEHWIGAFVAVLTGALSIGAYWTTRYDMKENHVILQSGWITRKDRRIPLEQIQNVNLRQNLLERLLKVATVDVETAKGHGHDMKLSVLTWADAELFREELLGAMGQASPTQEFQAEVPDFRLTQHDLLLGALTEIHFLQIFTTMFTFTGPVVGFVTSKTSAFPAPYQFAVVLMSCGLMLVVSWLWGALSYYFKYGGFTMKRTDAMIRITYGITQRIQLAIRPRRIELFRMTTTLVQRWMDRSSAYVGTSATFGEAGVLAPIALFVPTHVAQEQGYEVVPGMDLRAVQWKPFHPAFYFAPLVRGIVFCTLVLSLTAHFTHGVSHLHLLFAWGVAVFLVTWSTLRVVLTFLAKKENGFSISETAFVVRQGYFHQTISAIPTHRIENMSIKQPFWWVITGACQCTVQAMKNRVGVHAIPVADAKELQQVWVESMASQLENLNSSTEAHEHCDTVDTSQPLSVD